MECPIVIEISTRLRADWLSRCDQSGLSKAKAATFAVDAALLPFTAEPVQAIVLGYRDASRTETESLFFNFNEPAGYIRFFDCLQGTQPKHTSQAAHREKNGCRYIGHDLVEKLRVVAAAAAGLNIYCPLPALWYSHFFQPGVIVDPYADFLESDGRAVVSWESFCSMLLSGLPARPQGDSPEMVLARLQQSAANIWRVSDRLGLLSPVNS
jgi:hypothetical protein